MKRSPGRFPRVAAAAAAASSLFVLAPFVAGCSAFGDFSVLPPQEVPRPPAVVDAAAAIANASSIDGMATAPLLDAARAGFRMVRVTGELPPHLHRESDETVYVLEGHGDMLVDQEWRAVRAGMLIHVPRGVPHGFVNHADEGTLVLSVTTPPIAAGDRVPLDVRPR